MMTTQKPASTPTPNDPEATLRRHVALLALSVLMVVPAIAGLVAFGLGHNPWPVITYTAGLTALVVFLGAMESLYHPKVARRLGLPLLGRGADERERNISLRAGHVTLLGTWGGLIAAGFLWPEHSLAIYAINMTSMAAYFILIITAGLRGDS